MFSDTIQITHTENGNINVQSLGVFDDTRLVVQDDSPVKIIRIDEEQRIHIDGTDIITGNVFITADQNIEVVRIIEQGPKGEKGDKGDRGEPGYSGAGKPFYEIVSGVLFESTSSISITENLSVTGSVYIGGNIIIGENITPSSTSILKVTGHVTGSLNIVKFGNQTSDFMTINSSGVTVFGEISTPPAPVDGGFYFSGNGFYLGY